MNTNPRIPLFARFETQLLFLILLVIAPAIGLFVYGHFEQQQIEQTRAREGVLAISHLAAASEENLIAQAKQLLATLSDLSFLSLAKDSNFCQSHFSNLQKLLPDYVNFGLIETNGTLFCTGSALMASPSTIHDPLVNQVIQTRRFAIAGDSIDLRSEQPSLNIGYPVFDSQKQVQRVIFASIHRSRLSETLKQIRLPPGSTITVTDPHGFVLARKPGASEWVGKSLSNTSPMGRLIFQTNQVFEIREPDSKARLVALSKIDDANGTKVLVAASVPSDLSLARIQLMFFRNLLILGTVSLVILVLARIYAEQFFLSPIRKLILAANRLADGDLAARTGITEGSTELNQLAMRFDLMAAALMQRHGEIEDQKAEISKMNGELESRVAERTERLAFMNRELEAFSYSVSHDLRAPIRHIDGFGDLLQKHSSATLDEKGTRYLRMIRESSRRMGTLIDDLLLFSRIGREELRQIKFSMMQIVEEVRTTLRPDMEGRAIEWEIQQLPEVKGDPGMFRQVWLNLIDNAVKYTKTRGFAKIVIGCNTEKPGTTIFFIRDNGVGFQMQYVNKLFGVFQRLHSESEFEGTGVGLANVRRIVSRHGGETWAEGEPDKGASFYFSIPATRDRD